MDNRGLTPVVGKALGVGIVLLYIGILTTVLYGSVIPEYRTATADEIGERALATAAERVQQSVPPPTRYLDARFSVELPATIRDRTYSLRVSNRSLILDHPHSTVGGRVPLALPGTVSNIEGTWHSHDPLIIRIEGGDSGYSITLNSEEHE